MAVRSIESLRYGVEDIDACVKYFDDWGLEKLEAGKSGATFQTVDGSTIVLRSAKEKSLPASPGSGSTVREVIWGVDSAAGLDDLGAELSKDRDVETDGDGVLHTHDGIGNALGFRVSQITPDAPDVPTFNGVQTNARVNQRNWPDERPKLRRIGHVVYGAPEGLETAREFYMERVGFNLTDTMTGRGYFMRYSGLSDHHTVFVINAGPNRVGFDHAAFEVRNFDEVMMAGQQMEAAGWETSMGPGRHMLGSNIFWYFKCPAGGQTEYFADVDRMDDAWEPREFDGSTNTYASWLARPDQVQPGRREVGGPRPASD